MTWLRGLVTSTRLTVMSTVLLALGAFGGLTAVAHQLSSGPAKTLSPEMAAAIQDAGRSLVNDSRVLKVDAGQAPGVYQVGLVDASGRCWKAEVAVTGGWVTPVGRPALFGCWPAVHTDNASGPADNQIDAAARGFLSAYLNDGDLSRFAKPGVVFPKPAPVKDFAVSEVRQQTVPDGWLAQVDGRIGPTPVTYQLHLIATQLGPVVDHYDAGPPVSTLTLGPPVAVPSSTTTTVTGKE